MKSIKIIKYMIASLLLVVSVSSFADFATVTISQGNIRGFAFSDAYWVRQMSRTAFEKYCKTMTQVHTEGFNARTISIELNDGQTFTVVEAINRELREVADPCKDNDPFREDLFFSAYTDDPENTGMKGIPADLENIVSGTIERNDYYTCKKKQILLSYDIKTKVVHGYHISETVISCP